MVKGRATLLLELAAPSLHQWWLLRARPRRRESWLRRARRGSRNHLASRRWRRWLWLCGCAGNCLATPTGRWLVLCRGGWRLIAMARIGRSARYQEVKDWRTLCTLSKKRGALYNRRRRARAASGPIHYWRLYRRTASTCGGRGRWATGRTPSRTRNRSFLKLSRFPPCLSMAASVRLEPVLSLFRKKKKPRRRA